MDVSPGARVGAYEIVAPLGRGGMGQVFRPVIHGSGAKSRPAKCRIGENVVGARAACA